MDSGTWSSSARSARRDAGAVARPSWAPNAARIGGLAVAVALSVGLTPSVAAAVPPGPSDTQIATAQAQADAVQARIGALSGQLTAAEEAVEDARVTALIALDQYQATEASYLAAQQQADAAAAAAAQADADLGVARTQMMAFARRSYMEGSTFAGAAALITAADPGELIQRAALLEAAGSHRSDVLTEVTVLRVQAAEAETLAANTLATAVRLQEEAAASLAVAETAEASARQQAAALETQQAQLTTELAGAQAELTALVGQRAAAERAAQVTAPPQPPPPVQTTPAPSGNSTSAGAGDASKAQIAIDAAMAYEGLPYAWGGGGTRGPGYGHSGDEDVWGFDCSGLTQYAYGQAGISIPRNSSWQYSALPKVSRDDLRPGDLVFWARNTSDPATIHHVAIWLGGDRILEAPQSGSFVQVTEMRWKGYIGAGRPSA
ncbi:cell wall-associated NlpC family hydrolase [Blastococcus colisei]|uniref:Cell wall-associated NlpC family hydrolase n=1 Tax=Blastococcus colisei TaxID=1564162 RepID=A0A543PEF3_9ACTN|nr:C40 family peptidase [Blastococcus colisei]TQN42472.1 cell wall-associated NlpC family hydrolase [Blastococcus colisei]